MACVHLTTRNTTACSNSNRNMAKSKRTAAAATTMATSVRDTLRVHFEAHQQQSQQSSSSSSSGSRHSHKTHSIAARVNRIQLELDASATVLNSTNPSSTTATTSKKKKNSKTSLIVERDIGYYEEIAKVLLDFVHIALIAEDDTTDDAVVQSQERILELAAAVAVHLLSQQPQQKDWVLTTLLAHAADLSTVLLERIRAQACHWMGCFAREITLVLGTTTTTTADYNEDDVIAVPKWEETCLDQIQKALLIRLGDKSQLVRNAAIRAGGNFFLLMMTESVNSRADDADSTAAAAAMEPARRRQVLVNALLWNLSHDPSLANRMQVLSSLPITSTTTITTKVVDHVLERVRDVKSKVRVQALEALCHDSSNRTLLLLNSQQCAELVRAGLTDRCAATKEAASRLICTGWMKTVKYNPIALMKHLDVILYDEECERVLRVVLEACIDSNLLKGLSQNEIRAFREGVDQATIRIQGTTDLVCLDPEPIFVSRVACRFAWESKQLTAAQKTQIIARVVPDIPVLCRVFSFHGALLRQAILDDDDDEALEERACFVASQLLLLAQMSDDLQQEEGSRRHFTAEMKTVLASLETPDELVEGCLNAMKGAFYLEHELEFVQAVAGIIESIAASNNNNDNNNNVLANAATTTTTTTIISGGNNDELEKTNTASAELLRRMRILSILAIVLETFPEHLVNHPILSDFHPHIVSAVTHSDMSVREAGVSCLGKLGLLTKEETLLTDFRPLMLRVAANPDEKLEIRGQALLALTDWAMLYGQVLTPSCIINDDDDNNNNNKAAVSLTQLISDMLSNHQSTLGGIAVAAEAAAKLLFSGKYCDSSVIAHLLVVFFDEQQQSVKRSNNAGGGHVVDDDIKQVGSPERLQQLLSLFFPAYSMSSSTGREALLGSIGPLLKQLYIASQASAKKKNRMTAGNVVKMVQYVCSTVDLALNQSSSERSNMQRQAEKDTTATTIVDDEEEAVDTTTITLATATLLPPKDSASNTYLVASVQITEFLTRGGADSVGTMLLRGLCKFLGGASSVIDNDDNGDDMASNEIHLLKKTLKKCLEELGMIITDGTALRSLVKLNDVLADVNEDDGDDDETETEVDEGEDEEECQSEGVDESREESREESVTESDEEEEEEEEEACSSGESTVVNEARARRMTATSIATIDTDKENSTPRSGHTNKPTRTPSSMPRPPRAARNRQR